MSKCEYNSSHFRRGVKAAGVVESPYSGAVPACEQCIQEFHDSLCEFCDMPGEPCDCEEEEE